MAASFGDEFDMADLGTLLEQDPDAAFTRVRESLQIDRVAMDELREREVSAFLDGNRVELEAARAGLNGGGT